MLDTVARSSGHPVTGCQATVNLVGDRPGPDWVFCGIVWWARYDKQQQQMMIYRVYWDPMFWPMPIPLPIPPPTQPY
jgi:hypothetical protein